MDPVRKQTVSRASRDGVEVLLLDGVVSIIAADELVDAARQIASAGGRVVVDCADVEHLDTSTLQILVALERQLASKGRALTLTGVKPAVQAYVELAGLAGELSIGTSAGDVAATGDTR